jgi:aspartate racemase
MNNKPLVGILGGMGTYSGLYFQNLFFDVCTKNGISGDQNYPEWIYLNSSLAPDRTSAIINHGESPLPYLVSQLKMMESIGVSVVVVVCNTAHAFYDEIIKDVPLPWVHLPYLTAAEVIKSGVKNIGLIGTEGLLISGVYSKTFREYGMELKEPQAGSEQIKKIMSAIYDKEFGIKYSGSIPDEKALDLIKDVVHDLNIDSLVIGCTELSLAFSYINLPIRIFDPMKIAAEALFDIWSGKLNIEDISKF